MLMSLLCPIFVLAAEEGELLDSVVVMEDAEVMGETEEKEAEWVNMWEYYGYDSLDDFMLDYDYTEEEYNESETILNMRLNDQAAYAEYVHQLLIAQFERFGGTYGVLNVIIDDTFVDFGSVLPEIIGGTLYVPTAPFVESLGAEVEYDGKNKTISIKFDNMTAYIVIGDNIITIAENGIDRKEFIYDEPFLKNNISYIPLRAVAEALGYTVFWDNTYKTAVIIDFNGFIDKINEEFTIVNKLLDFLIIIDDGRNGVFQQIVELLVSYTEINSLDGNNTLLANGDLNFLSDGKNFYFKGSVDFSSLVKLFIPYRYYYNDDYYETLIDEYTKLSKMMLELIYNNDDDVLYMKFPLLSDIFTDLPPNAWIAVSNMSEIDDNIDVESFIDTLYQGSIPNGISIGEIIVLDNSLKQPSSNVYLYYYHLRSSSVLYRTFISDEKFDKDDDEYTLSLSLEDLEEYAYTMATAYQVLSFYLYYLNTEKLDAKLTVQMSNDEIVAFMGEFFMRNSSYYSGDTQITGNFNFSVDEIEMFMEIHQQNDYILGIELNVSSKDLTEEIPQAPPTGAIVISIEDIVESFTWPSFISQLAGVAN